MARMKLITKLGQTTAMFYAMIRNFMATFLLLGLHSRQKSKIIDTHKNISLVAIWRMKLCRCMKAL